MKVFEVQFTAITDGKIELTAPNLDDVRLLFKAFKTGELMEYMTGFEFYISDIHEIPHEKSHWWSNVLEASTGCKQKMVAI